MRCRSLRVVLSSWLLVSLGFGAPNFSAFADLPSQKQVKKSPEAAALELLELREGYDRLLNLSDADIEAVFTIRDAKGNRRTLRSASSAEGEAWAHLDPSEDQVEGTSTNKAYRDLKIKTDGAPVIVAVIDGGIDVDHEDFSYVDEEQKRRSIIWTNEGETPGNGIDDDQNGFVDDIHGWNFLGSKDGKNVTANNLELTRELGRLKKLEASGVTLDESQEKYKTELQAAYDQRAAEAKTGADQLAVAKANVAAYTKADAVLKENGWAQPKDASPQDIITSIRAMGDQGNPNLKEAKRLATLILERTGMTLSQYSERVKAFEEHVNEMKNVWLNFDINVSATIGDDPTRMDDRYGNPNVAVLEDAKHGTHVAGIIGALRENGKGMNGQASNVRIMSLRVVPGAGDERDKDVANAIFYAVNNGAKVINGSFGKDFSPNRDYVRKAVRYAEEKGVLIVHAAGNDHKSNDTSSNFPNRLPMPATKDGVQAPVTNWIEVGASGPEKGEDLAADFSNYGKKTVDLFAPGVAILSTLPNNQYQELQGTSMAAPQVAGIAALVLSQKPELTPAQVRELLMSTTRQYPGQEVRRPGSQALVHFDSLSISGGIVDTFGALKTILQ